MKKKIICFMLIVFTCLIAIGCGGGTKEDSPLILSSQELDGVFNPFFSSSAPDSQIVSMTQISMLGNDKEGNVTYGDEEGVVVKDIEEVYDEDEDMTTYYLVLKNNVKFSNGSPLTILSLIHI